jgi:hypothetical protein
MHLDFHPLSRKLLHICLLTSVTSKATTLLVYMCTCLHVFTYCMYICILTHSHDMLFYREESNILSTIPAANIFIEAVSKSAFIRYSVKCLIVICITSLREWRVEVCLFTATVGVLALLHLFVHSWWAAMDGHTSKLKVFPSLSYIIFYFLFALWIL